MNQKKEARSFKKKEDSTTTQFSVSNVNFYFKQSFRSHLQLKNNLIPICV